MSTTNSFKVEDFPYICEPIRHGGHLWKFKLWMDHEEKEMVIDFYMMVEKAEDIHYLVATIKLAKMSNPHIKYCESYKTKTECESDGEWYYRAGSRYSYLYDCGPIQLDIIVVEDPDGLSWTIEDFFRVEEWMEDDSGDSPKQITAKDRRLSYANANVRSGRLDSFETFMEKEIDKLEDNEMKILKMMQSLRLDLQELKGGIRSLKQEQQNLETELRRSHNTLSDQNERLREEVRTLGSQLKLQGKQRM